jgi:ATP-dependent RNA helicase A
LTLKYQIHVLAITGRETGSNKQTASKSCALSIVRQLYHLGVIEAFSGTLKKNKDTEQLKPYPVKISPELENQIQEVLTNLDIKPIDVTSSYGRIDIKASHFAFNTSIYLIRYIIKT